MKSERPDRASSRHLIVIAAAIALLSALTIAPHVEATPIPIGASSANDLIFNLDFTSKTPPPPYTSQQIVWTISGWGAGETIIFETFGDANGLDLISSAPISGPETFETINLFNYGALGDGILSIGVRMDSGAADFTSVTVTEFAPFDFDTIGRGTPVSITITTPAAPVPESATLVLLIAGLVALGFVDWHKAHGSNGGEVTSMPRTSGGGATRR